jgi:hypothetical protein
MRTRSLFRSFRLISGLLRQRPKLSFPGESGLRVPLLVEGDDSVNADVKRLLREDWRASAVTYEDRPESRYLVAMDPSCPFT